MPSPHRIPRGGKTCLEITCQFDPRHGFPRQAFTTYDCLLISVAFVVLCRVGCLWVTGVISIDEIRLAPSINRTHDPSPMIRSPTLYWLQPHRPTPPPPPPPPPLRANYEDIYCLFALNAKYKDKHIASS